ncbi:MAG: methyltransferase domain-containing protein, partial [Patescibacteria group bacterium]
SLLLPNGMIALSTPDVGSMVARVLGKRWHAYVPPEHLWYFSGSTMRRLLERNGFSDITVRKIGKRFTLAYMAKTLATTHPSRFAALMASFIQKTGLGAIVIPFNLRDNIFVTARKSAISARI